MDIKDIKDKISKLEEDIFNKKRELSQSQLMYFYYADRREERVEI